MKFADFWAEFGDFREFPEILRIFVAVIALITFIFPFDTPGLSAEH
jgi:hypothetical protein